jgi:PadR family transcriptional regulator, regulatory protein PadR
MENVQTIVDGLVQDLRRGNLVLLVLSQLAVHQYGYSLVQSLEGKGLAIEPGTLYPLLRRLEKQGLLDSKWDIYAGHPRRYYILSAAGRDVLAAMIVEWQKLVELTEKLLPDQNRNSQTSQH